MGQSMDRALNEPGLLVEPLVDLGEIERVKTRISILGVARNPGSVAFVSEVRKLFDEWRESIKSDTESAEFWLKLEYMEAPSEEKERFIRKLSKFIVECVCEPKELEVDPTQLLGGGSFRLAKELYTAEPYVYDQKSLELTNIHPETLITDHAKFGKEAVKELTTDILPCKVVFNPRTIERTWNEDVQEGAQSLDVVCFNRFNAPPYRRVKAPTPECLSEIDPNFLDYFDTLCHHNDETKHVVLSWLKVALMDRAKTILVFVGQGATGKSFFARLFGRLVGKEYFMQAQNEFFDSRFVSGLNKNRCIFIDEGDMANASRVGHAKKYVEDTFSSEEKGKEAIANQTIHASLIYASNYASSLALTPNERKFTVPDAGNMPQRWGTIAEWNAFEERMLNDDRKLKMLYNFLETYETDWQPATNFRGEKFWEIVLEGGLTDPQRLIYHKLLDLKEPIDLEVFKQSCNREGKFKIGTKYIANLLHAFELGGRPIGEITPTGQITNLKEYGNNDQDEDFDLDFDGLDVL